MPHHNTRKRPVEVRFWEKVAKAGPDDCWLWTASTYKNGYGQFGVTPRKTTSAHRFSYELHYGPIPKGKVIRHRCDRILCCNPSHLEIGTQQDNVNDMMKRNRKNPARGERQRSAKLTDESVRLIRSIHATGMHTYSGIARRFKVTYPTIINIVKRATWTHVE